VRANTNQSSNWFGYNQGTLEQGSKLFNSIAGDWTVPTVSQHTSGQAEASSDWIGIGGGCIDAGCTTTDSTLIQAGTEQDVDSTGSPFLLRLVRARARSVADDQRDDGHAR
jgi:Peptidase A4 family